MQFCSNRRKFLKLGMALLPYPTTRNMLSSALVSESLYISNSHADTVCSQLTVDSTLYTIDSTLINISCGTSIPDSDSDGLSDASEVFLYGTNPQIADTDGDNLSDGLEVIIYGTNPLIADTDGDGFTDEEEVMASSNPLDPDSYPLISDGDINLDGKVDGGDLVQMQRIILEKEQYTAEQLQHADVAPLVNGVPRPDGKLNAGDLVVLTRKVLGIINF